MLAFGGEDEASSIKVHRNARKHTLQASTFAARRIRRCQAMVRGALWLCDAPGCHHEARAGARGWVRLPGLELHACSVACADAIIAAAIGPMPRTRGECRGGPRPCPWVRCKWHLYLDVDPATGAMRVAFPDLEPWELDETCALDVADRGSHGPLTIGKVTNMTRERVRQIFWDAMKRVGPKMAVLLKKKAPGEGGASWAGGEKTTHDEELGGDDW